MDFYAPVSAKKPESSGLRLFLSRRHLLLLFSGKRGPDKAQDRRNGAARGTPDRHRRLPLPDPFLAGEDEVGRRRRRRPRPAAWGTLPVDRHRRTVGRLCAHRLGSGAHEPGESLPHRTGHFMLRKARGSGYLRRNHRGEGRDAGRLRPQRTLHMRDTGSVGCILLTGRRNRKAGGATTAGRAALRATPYSA